MGPPFSTGFRMKVGGLVLAAGASFRTSEDEGRENYASLPASARSSVIPA